MILSGGESLLDPVRERVTYKVIEALRDKYAAQGGVKIVVQTTGDVLTDAIVADLLARGVWMISVASVDDFHVGLEGPAKQQAFMDKLSALFARHGMRQSGLSATTRNWHEEPGPVYSFFGATPDSWIGKLWPRGRAWQNNLSHATLADNFCNRWSGGLNFLRHEFNGSEVSIEPDGAVYPCCIKTKLPVGSLLEDNLIEILDSLTGVPAYEAITMGHPERMGIAYGFGEQDFIAQSRTRRPDGAAYENLCIGCDRFHAQVLGPVLEEARQRRRAAKGLAAADAAAPRDRTSRAQERLMRTAQLGIAALLAFAASGVQAAHAQDLRWNDVVAKARGQTVNFNAWAGDEKTNAFIQWAGEEVAKRYGVKVNHVKLKDTAEAVTRVVAEKAAGRDTGGTVDLVWINGPNFLAMKEQRLLFGPFTQAMPNYARVDTTNVRSNVIDFTIPVDGMESPWRRAQVVFVYDGKRVQDPPRSVPDLLRWAKEHPGRLTHPSVRNFLGIDVPEAGAARTRARPGRAAAPGNRRELRGGHRTALGVVRRAAPRPVAAGAAVSGKRPRAAAAHERRRDRHDDLVQSGRGRGVDQRRPPARTPCARSCSPRARSATRASSRSRTTPRTRKARWSSPTSCSTRPRRRARRTTARWATSRCSTSRS